MHGETVGYAYVRVGACVRARVSERKRGEGVKNSLWLLSEYSPHAPLSAGLVYLGHAAGCASGTRLGRTTVPVRCGAVRCGAHQNKAASAPLPHRVEGKSMNPDKYRSFRGTNDARRVSYFPNKLSKNKKIKKMQ